MKLPSPSQSHPPERTPAPRATGVLTGRPQRLGAQQLGCRAETASRRTAPHPGGPAGSAPTSPSAVYAPHAQKPLRSRVASRRLTEVPGPVRHGMRARRQFRDRAARLAASSETLMRRGAVALGSQPFTSGAGMRRTKSAARALGS